MCEKVQEWGSENPPLIYHLGQAVGFGRGMGGMDDDGIGLKVCGTYAPGLESCSLTKKKISVKENALVYCQGCTENF